MWQEIEMTGPIMNGAYVRKRMRELGLKQRDLAQALNLPQSAISNILNGKRRVQVDEAKTLFQLLQYERKDGEGIPVLPLSLASKWERAREETRLLAHYTGPSASENSFIIETDAGPDGLLPGLLHVLVNPDRRSLFAGGMYLIEAGGDFSFYRYFENPSRLQALPPNQHWPVFDLGHSQFRVIGEVEAVIKRPASLRVKVDDPDVEYDS